MTHNDLAQLVTRADPFSASGWLFELSYDGCRCLCLREEDASLLSRRGDDLSRAFPEVIGDLLQLPPGTALDGELVILDRRGYPDPRALHSRKELKDEREIARAALSHPASVIAWDILTLSGKDLRALTLLRRKTVLHRAVQSLSRVCFARHVSGDGESMYALAQSEGLGGIVAKRADSPYKAGPTQDWLRIRIAQRSARAH